MVLMMFETDRNAAVASSSGWMNWKMITDIPTVITYPQMVAAIRSTRTSPVLRSLIFLRTSQRRRV